MENHTFGLQKTKEKSLNHYKKSLQQTARFEWLMISEITEWLLEMSVLNYLNDNNVGVAE